MSNSSNNSSNHFKRVVKLEGKTNQSTLKYTFLKFNVEGKCRFVITQNHNSNNRMPMKYFYKNRWSGKLNTRHVLSMKNEAEFVELMRPFNLFDTNSDGVTLTSSFTILAAQDLERKY